MKIVLSAICAITALQGADAPKFDTASVKRMDRCAFQNSIDPGRISFRGDPLKLVLMEAFKVKTEEISGPSWLDEDCFEIVASMPEGSAREQMPAMLQALLAERFKLASHKETRTRSGYALVVDKNGPKFRESEPNPNVVTAGRTMFRFSGGTSGFKGSMTMESLARQLSNKGYGPVRDSTELKGKYDIDLAWAPDPSFERPGPFAQASADAHPNAEPPPAPSADMFTAIRALGLRLEPRKVPVEMLVIDHVERIPSEN